MSTSRGDWARWGLLTTTLVLGVTLIATTLSSHRGIVEASAQLARGHGENLVRSLRRELGPVRQLPTAARLTELLELHRSEGLFHLSIVDERSRSLVEVGEPWAVPEPSRAPDGRGDHGWRRQGDRFQLVTPLDRPGRGRRHRDRPRRGPRRNEDRTEDDRRPRDGGGPERHLEDFGPFPNDPPGRDENDRRDKDRREGDRRDRAPSDGPRRPPPPERFLAVGFESPTAAELTRQTAGALGLGTASALLLMLAAVVFWRQSRTRERARRQLEHQQRMSSLGEMSAVLAHEILNPLASLKGHAQLLAEQLGERADDPEGRKIVRIVGEATRLEKLTQDLLAFARTGALDRRPVDPVELVEACRQEVAPERVRVLGNDAPGTWTLDRTRLHQVLTNLLRNALQASPEEATVEVRIDRQDTSGGQDRLRIRIRDQGEGLPEGREGEIFEPFFTTRTRGVGLGLAVARRIVELHGGELVARNHPEGGAELEIRLPHPPTAPLRAPGVS